MNRIDLSCVIQILEDAHELAEQLDGQELDEREAVTSQSKGPVRASNAALSKGLSALADLQGLGQFLTRQEYWRPRDMGAQIDVQVHPKDGPTQIHNKGR